MKISKRERQKARHLFRECQANGSLQEDRVRAVVRGLVTQKPRGYLSVVRRFAHLVKLEIQRRTARVEDAVETPAGLKASIQEKLERRHGPGLNTTFEVNPELIGGLRIRVGSDVYDGSIRARLDELKNRF